MHSVPEVHVAPLLKRQVPAEEQVSSERQSAVVEQEEVQTFPEQRAVPEHCVVLVQQPGFATQVGVLPSHSHV
jgi:hypothetical protein